MTDLTKAVVRRDRRRQLVVTLAPEGGSFTFHLSSRQVGNLVLLVLLFLLRVTQIVPRGLTVRRLPEKRYAAGTLFALAALARLFPDLKRFQLRGRKDGHGRDR